MFDKELLTTVIDRWLDGREVMLSQLEETNGFSKEESDKFEANTKKVEELKEELANNDYVLKNDYLRLAADFDNYKKRSIQQATNYSFNATKDILLDVLGIYDEFERLVKELDKKMPAEKMLSATCDDPLQVAVRMIFKNFTNLLNVEGCFMIECSYGDKFDVNTMEAIAVREIKDDEGYDPDDVVEIYQTGWKYKDKVIRPVKVVVGK